MDEKKLNPITKLDAAHRQLDCAIRMYFDQSDSLCIHTLGYAAFKILYDLYPKKRTDQFTEQLERQIGMSLGWKYITHVPNFLKHADNDADAILENHSSERVCCILGWSCILHHRITGRMTAEMRAFDTLTHLLNPDVFKIPPDPDPEFEADYRRMIEFIKEDSSNYFIIGNALISLFRENPDLLGYGSLYTIADHII